MEQFEMTTVLQHRIELTVYGETGDSFVKIWSVLTDYVYWEGLYKSVLPIGEQQKMWARAVENKVAFATPISLMSGGFAKKPPRIAAWFAEVVHDGN